MGRLGLWWIRGLVVCAWGFSERMEKERNTRVGMVLYTGRCIHIKNCSFLKVRWLTHLAVQNTYKIDGNMQTYML